MRNVLVGCRKPVCKLCLGCAQGVALNTCKANVLGGLFINRWLFRHIIHWVTFGFSTPFLRGFSLLVTSLYSVSTRPTSATTSFINLFKFSYCREVCL